MIMSYLLSTIGGNFIAPLGDASPDKTSRTEQSFGIENNTDTRVIKKT